jgi:hypothetical protein
VSEPDPEIAVALDQPVVVDEAEDSEQALPFVYEITSYGADYPVDGLVKRIEAGDIFVPDFQRDYVWEKKQSDRFIESLLLGLPVPGIFLAREPNSKRLLVLDGQQRLRTLQDFYRGIFRGKEFVLEHVQERFRGLKYETLDEDDRRRMDDAILHATVVRQDDPSEDQSSIYFLFERINTGGTTLAPQEVRYALYQGAFNNLLGELNLETSWRDVYGKKSIRRKDEELILRFLALKHERAEYRRPMETFLSTFMARNRTLSQLDPELLRAEFRDAIGVVAASVGKRAFRLAQSINAAVFDSVMVALSERLDVGQINDPEAVGTAYEALLADDEYVQACSRATADTERLALRMDLAAQAFSDLE